MTLSLAPNQKNKKIKTRVCASPPPLNPNHAPTFSFVYRTHVFHSSIHLAEGESRQLTRGSNHETLYIAFSRGFLLALIDYREVPLHEL
jgi:hypothetical protein